MGSVGPQPDLNERQYHEGGHRHREQGANGGPHLALRRAIEGTARTDDQQDASGESRRAPLVEVQVDHGSDAPRGEQNAEDQLAHREDRECGGHVDPSSESGDGPSDLGQCCHQAGGDEAKRLERHPGPGRERVESQGWDEEDDGGPRAESGDARDRDDREPRGSRVFRHIGEVGLHIPGPPDSGRSG